jgi:GPH family glycoside/pentoside/hexuronide:cation symporter
MDKNKKQLSSRNFWGYAIGAIPNGFLVMIFNLKYIEFFYDKLTMAPLFFIIGQILYMTVNSLNDPLTGQLSDRTNVKKWGSRRLIYIKYGGPIYALTLILVFFPWSWDNQIIIFWHFVISVCLFDTMLSLIALVWLALLPEMTSDIDERNKASLLAGIFASVFIIPVFLIISDMDPTSSEFMIFIIIIAVISTFLFWLNAYLCEERTEFSRDEGLPLWKAIKESLKSKAFIFFMLYNFCQAYIGSIGLSYLFVYELVLGTGGILFYFLIVFFLAFISNFIFIKMRKKSGMYKLMLRFGSIRVVLMFLFFLIILFFDDAFLILLFFATNTLLNGYSVFKDPLMYLAMDEDEIKTGSRREGMFLGINALIVKPATSLGPIIATLLLGVFGYIQGAEASLQPNSAILAAKILMFLIPAIVSALGLLAIYFYPLHGEKLEEMKEQLEKLHAEKRERID